MTRHLATTRACIAAAVGTFLAACYAVALSGTPWLCVPGFYTAALFAWCAAHHYALHHRSLAEHEWARRRALGENPPPLNPCCRLAARSHGQAHDHKCTDTSTRSAA